MFGTMLLAFTVLLGADVRPDATSTPRPKAANKLAAKDVGDITGYYTCRGRDGKGGEYTGVAVISKQKEVYVVQWTIGIGAAFIGLGIRQGDMLAVSWAMPGDKAGVVRGINLYRIEPGPRLTGQWATLPGNGMINTETLNLLKRLGDE
jgi:hypothetical protein